MIEQFLRKTPEDRIGITPPSYENVKSCLWFEEFEWDKLLEKSMKAPEIPKYADLDTSDWKDFHNF